MVRTNVFRIHGTYESTPSLKTVMQEYTGHRRSMSCLVPHDTVSAQGLSRVVVGGGRASVELSTLGDAAEPFGS